MIVVEQMNDRLSGTHVRFIGGKIRPAARGAAATVDSNSSGSSGGAGSSSTTNLGGGSGGVSLSPSVMLGPLFGAAGAGSAAAGRLGAGNVAGVGSTSTVAAGASSPAKSKDDVRIKDETAVVFNSPWCVSRGASLFWRGHCGFCDERFTQHTTDAAPSSCSWR